MTLFKMVKEAVTTRWLKARCLICGLGYKYPKGGYQPKSCDSFHCVQKHLHPELSKERR